MRRKLTSLAAIMAAIVLAAFQAGSVQATPSSGFTGTTIAQGAFEEINVFNHLVQPGSERPRHHTRKLWLSLQKTKGSSDLYVQNNVWQPGGTTGWHTHPGPDPGTCPF